MSVRKVLALGALIVLVIPRVVLAEFKAPTTAPADRAALGAVLVNVLEYPPREIGPPIRVLLDKGADPNVRAGREASTPLHALMGAARRPGEARAVLEAANFLLRHGADPSIRNAEGQTPLALARQLDESTFKTDLLGLLQKPPTDREKPAPPLDVKGVKIALNDCVWNVIQYPPDDAAVLIECLLRVGADPRSDAGIGDVLLHGLAFNCGNTWTVSKNDWRRAAVALLKAGADVNGQSAGDGRTPLDDAVHTTALNAQYGHSGTAEFEMIQFLLDHGADPSIRDKAGKTASDGAAEIKDDQIRKRVLDLLNKKRD